MKAGSKDSAFRASRENTGQKDGWQWMTHMIPKIGEAKGTTGISKPEIGIETIHREGSIVTISKLHTLEILEFEGGKIRIKTLASLVPTRARVRSKKIPTLRIL